VKWGNRRELLHKKMGGNLGFHIAVHDAVGVREIEGSEKLVHVETAIEVGEVGVEMLVGSVVDEFEDETGGLRVRVAHHVHESHYVCSAVQILQDLDLSPVN
jgi:hypothetical protein